MLHRRLVLFSTPIPRCSSNHCLDSVGFLFAREQINSTEMSSKSTFLSPYHYDFPLVTRSPSTPMKINRYTVIFVTLNADALMAIRPVGFEPTIADSKGRCLKPIWPWTQNKTGTGRFELPTTRLTAGHSTAELRANKLRKTRRGVTPP